MADLPKLIYVQCINGVTPLGEEALDAIYSDPAALAARLRMGIESPAERQIIADLLEHPPRAGRGRPGLPPADKFARDMLIYIEYCKARGRGLGYTEAIQEVINSGLTYDLDDKAVAAIVTRFRALLRV
jgi:hypothetical protein